MALLVSSVSNKKYCILFKSVCAFPWAWPHCFCPHLRLGDRDEGCKESLKGRKQRNLWSETIAGLPVTANHLQPPPPPPVSLWSSVLVPLISVLRVFSSLGEGAGKVCMFDCTHTHTHTPLFLRGPQYVVLCLHVCVCCRLAPDQNQIRESSVHNHRSQYCAYFSTLLLQHCSLIRLLEGWRRVELCGWILNLWEQKMWTKQESLFLIYQLSFLFCSLSRLLFLFVTQFIIS